MPRRGGLPLFIRRCRAVILRCWARYSERGYQQGRINKGRSPQNCMERGYVSARPSDAILRDDELICFAHHKQNKDHCEVAASRRGSPRPLNYSQTTLKLPSASRTPPLAKQQKKDNLDGCPSHTMINETTVRLFIAYRRASFASMHSVACGTRNRRSRGMSFPVVLQIP